MEGVNLGAWKILQDEDPALGKFAKAYTAAGIVSSMSNEHFNEAVKILQSKDPTLWTKTEGILTKAVSQFNLQQGPDMQTDCLRHIALSVMHSRDYLQSKI